MFAGVSKPAAKKTRPHSSPDPSSARTKCKFKLVSVLRKSISPENSFGKTESELKPRHTARILGGQNPERKTPFPFSEKIRSAQNQKCKKCFFFRGCRVKRGGGGAFVERTIQFQATTRTERVPPFGFEKAVEFCFGALGRNRTCDPLDRNQMLYPLSYKRKK